MLALALALALALNAGGGRSSRMMPTHWASGGRLLRPATLFPSGDGLLRLRPATLFPSWDGLLRLRPATLFPSGPAPVVPRRPTNIAHPLRVSISPWLLG